MDEPKQQNDGLDESLFKLLVNLDWRINEIKSELDAIRNRAGFNPTNAIGAAHSIHHGFTLHAGRVLFGIPMTQAYYVIPAGANTVVRCKLVTKQGAGPIGASDSSTLPPLTPVFLLLHPSTSEGYIIGTDVPPHFASSETLNDIIVPDAEVGLTKNRAYLGLLRNAINVADYSVKTPTDGLALGEFCKNTATGTMLFLDDFMAVMRAAEDCGVWCFLQDGLLRTAGLNFEQWSGLTELYASVIKAPIFYFGVAPELFNNLGYNSKPNLTATNFEKRQRYERLKPNHADFEYRGGIATGHQQFTVLPYGQSKFGTESGHVPTSQIFRSYTGEFGVRSATGIYLVKAPNIQVPDRFRTLIEGDKKLEIDGAVTNVPGAGFDNVHLLNTINILDLHANLFFGIGLRHFNKLSTSKGGEYFKIIGKGSNTPLLTSLAGLLGSSGTAAPPPSSEHQANSLWPYQKATIYQNTAHISITPDGSIILGDGYGAEIKLTAGNIYITAPGDVFLDTGRNMLTFAGRDIICRARSHVELSSTLKDVRIKAENNMQLLAGNNGSGGILIESKAEVTASSDWSGTDGEETKHPGINLIAKDAAIQTKTRRIVNNVCDQIINLVPGGSIVSSAPFIVDVCSCALVQAFDPREREEAYCELESQDSGSGSGSPGTGKSKKKQPVSPVYNIFTHDLAVMHGNLIVHNDFLVAGSLGVGEHGYVAGDVLFRSARALNLAQMVRNENPGNAIISDVQSQISAADIWVWDVMQNMFASFRLDEQYKSDKFIYPMPRWAKALGEKEDAWLERPIENVILSFSSDRGKKPTKDRDSVTFPFPGKKYHDKNDKNFVQCVVMTDGVYTDVNGNLIVGIDEMGQPYEDDPATLIALSDKPIIG